jgi:mannose-6-phosphate isomerase-like protein (cupin superfamily)
MTGYVAAIADLTDKNVDFRRVLYTGKNLQLVLMSLNPGEEIGDEVHKTGDQFFRVESGNGEVRINGNSIVIKNDDAFVVPAGAQHNVINSGQQPLKLYTIYAPPHHRDRFVAGTKAAAEASKEHFDGKTTE